MIKKSNHIIVFLCFEQIEVIKRSFDSIYNDEVDFFIVENKSKNSNIIQEYFSDKDLKGYIQFEENISATAMDIFIKDYKSLLEQYEYITLTDGDLYIYDIKSTLEELRFCLDGEDVGFSSTRLWDKNNYTNKDRIIGVNPYIEYMSINDTPMGYHISPNGFYMVTLKRENLSIVEGIHIIDSYLLKRLRDLKKHWVCCNKNISYHLTWDLYIPGNEYYNFKIKNIKNIWLPKPPVDYLKIK